MAARWDKLVDLWVEEVGEGLHMGWQCHAQAPAPAPLGQKQHSSGGELGLPTRTSGLATNASHLLVHVHPAAGHTHGLVTDDLCLPKRTGGLR